MKKPSLTVPSLILLLFFATLSSCSSSEQAPKQPNILLAISDDQSYIHAGIYGYAPVRTPNLDQLARQGILFNNAFTASPMCTVARAALLTGRYPWQNGEAGQHWSHFPGALKTYPDLLKAAGYQVGYTGKCWGPGNWEITGRTQNPGGSAYNDIKLESKPASGINDSDYAANFKKFLEEKPEGKPFCFWYGASEPHGPYEKGSGRRAGYDTSGWELTPNFVNPSASVKEDLLDYFLEIEWFDTQLGRIIAHLKESGEFENTLIVVTADNGSPLPGAKGDLFDLGTHVPMVVVWPGKTKPGRVVDALVSQVDLAPLFIEAAGLPPHEAMSGQSLLNLILDRGIDSHHAYILAAQEKSSHNRNDHLGYPMRSIRDDEWLYIRNFKPERRPKRDPVLEEDPGSDPWNELRPPEHLYHLATDYACLNNLANDEEHAEHKQRLIREMEKTLTRQHDARMLGYGDMYESFPRYGPFKPELKGFDRRGEYNPDYLIEIPDEIFVSELYHKALKAKLERK
jgi:uncharacterized sulfatase